MRTDAGDGDLDPDAHPTAPKPHVADALNAARSAAERRTDGTLASILAALPICVADGTPADVGSIDELLEIELALTGANGEALRAYLGCLPRAERRGDPWILGCLNTRLCWVFGLVGDEDAALQCGEAAVAAFDEAGDVDRAIRAQNYVSVVWWRRGNAVEALRVGRAAMDRADAEGGLVERARVRINLSAQMELAQDYARGREVLREAMEIAGDNRHLKTVILLNTARIDVCETRFDDAEARLNEAFAIGIDLTHAWHVELWLLRGIIASSRGLSQDAHACFDRSFELAESADMRREQITIWRERSAALEREGRFDESLSALRTSVASEARLHRESDLIRAATAKERDAAEAARLEARQAREREETMGAMLAELQRSQRALEEAQIEKDRLLVELERQSKEDALTGVANRRALEEHLEREWVRSNRYGHPLSLALIDVDDFKQINDTHSHAVGDAVLVAIAALLTSSRRRNDIAARMGGEEFLMLFTETVEADAVAACEDFRNRMAQFDWSTTGVTRAVTASVGVVERQPDDTVSSILNRADEAMYRAKRSGKNRVCVDDDPGS